MRVSTLTLLVVLAIIMCSIAVSASDSDLSRSGKSGRVGIAARKVASAARKVASVASKIAAAPRALKAKAPESPALPAAPCNKKLQPELTIEQKYPQMVTDFHPDPTAIDINSISDKDADRTARVIIREHLAWEKENPAPPANPSTEELKEMGLQIEKQTLEIQKEGKAFKKLAKWVDDDHKDHLERVAKRQREIKEKAAAAVKAAEDKKKSLKLQAQIKAKLAAYKAKKKAQKLAKKMKKLGVSVPKSVKLAAQGKGKAQAKPQSKLSKPQSKLSKPQSKLSAKKL